MSPPLSLNGVKEYMNLRLTKEELTQVLRDKFGGMTFEVFYTESDKHWEARNNRKISEMVEAPTKESCVLYFND